MHQIPNLLNPKARNKRRTNYLPYAKGLNDGHETSKKDERELWKEARYIQIIRVESTLVFANTM